MRWAFVGIGRVTHRMVQAVRSAGHEVVLAAGRDPKKLRDWQDHFGVQHGTTDLNAACESEQVDAVYVALPPSLHAQYAIRAVESGKRVLCEKALTVSLDQAEEIRQAVVRTKVPLVHATAFPHHPRSLAMRSVIESGELGEICRISVACSVGGILDRRDHRIDASAGGGCLLDLGWYCVYSTLWFTGFRPSQIVSIGTHVANEPSSVWYQVQSMARLESSGKEYPKANRSLVASWDCGYEAMGRKWIEIAGTQASLICDDFLRPWDIEKPRFWVHGSDGKARSEQAGVGISQEAQLVRSLSSCTFEESLEALSLAIETQSILSRIDADLRR
ncbi:MAG: Gfo/Idh/MocA family oxidoreductase [Planctomycetota bacterium]|nr:Gfo/Idh/MocA family oxidoreductase [Planctomycetota bacterium]